MAHRNEYVEDQRYKAGTPVSLLCVSGMDVRISNATIGKLRDAGLVIKLKTAHHQKRGASISAIRDIVREHDAVGARRMGIWEAVGEA